MLLPLKDAYAPASQYVKKSDHWNDLRTTHSPHSNAPRATPLGPTALFADDKLEESLLVLYLDISVHPLCPLLVASTIGSTVAVFTVFVIDDVENVSGSWGVASESAVSEKKTRAKPGAGTWIWQTLLEQSIVWTFKFPERRPSDSKWLPKP